MSETTETLDHRIAVDAPTVHTNMKHASEPPPEVRTIQPPQRVGFRSARTEDMYLAGLMCE